MSPRYRKTLIPRRGKRNTCNENAAMVSPLFLSYRINNFKNYSTSTYSPPDLSLYADRSDPHTNSCRYREASPITGRTGLRTCLSNRKCSCWRSKFLRRAIQNDSRFTRNGRGLGTMPCEEVQGLLKNRELENMGKYLLISMTRSCSPSMNILRADRCFGFWLSFRGFTLLRLFLLLFRRSYSWTFSD